MTGIAEALVALTSSLIALVGAADRSPGEPDLREFKRLLERLPTPPDARPAGASPTRLPVLRYLGEAIRPGTAPASPLAAPLLALEPSLAWTQNPNYRRAPPTREFLGNYGYAVIAGPAGGAPALIHMADLALGLLLLGPKTEYPAHHHPAAEIYVPLGLAEWKLGDGPWRSRPAGSVIHHRPNVMHATRTKEAPLAALYLWAGDLATHARLADRGGGASEG
ncbi:MAG: dimethylsulfonioproprionate lyase family protein [Hyphomicrobiales bacterium]